MTGQIKKEQSESEKISVPEKGPAFERKPEGASEVNETLEDEKRIAQKLREEIELMGLDEKSSDEVKIKSEELKLLGEGDKIEHLLQIAREKGLTYAIQLAKKMNEPYILDALHDILAKEGFYKDFVK